MAEAKYPSIYVTADIVLLTIRDDQLQVLMVERGREPFLGRLALPGGFVKPNEDLREAALRELLEETSVRIKPKHLEQLATYGAPDRDPRDRIVSVAHLGVLASLPEPTAGTDAAEASWHSVTEMIKKRLPFDHSAILKDGLERARAKLEYSTLATAFCPTNFTIGELRRVYELVWGKELDPGNFHRKVLGSEGFIVPTGKERQSGRGRPSAIYRKGPAKTLHPPILR